MMKRKTLLLVLALTFFSLTSLSAQTSDYEVTNAVVTTRIANRMPEVQTADNRFASTVDTLFYFTKIEQAMESTSILHEWYWQGELLATVELDVDSDAWRTWSSKRIMPHQTGKWTVISKRPDGSTAQTTSFSLEHAARTVELDIQSTPGDAIVYDGSNILGSTGESGLNVVRFWEVGDYTLDITKAGYESGSIRISVEEEPTRVHEMITLKRVD
jgi:hypothetical protein